MLSLLKSKIARIFREEIAATTVEYAMLIAIILLFSISAILGSGDVQKLMWQDTADALEVIKSP